MKRIFDVNPWHVLTTDFKPENKRLQESMTSLGNGYMGMRGFFEEDYTGDTLPGIYLGGVWYPDKTRVGWWKNGYPEYFGKVINAVNFIKINFKLNGTKIDLATANFSDFKLDLDMQHGTLTRSFIVDQDGQRVRVTFERFLSVAQKELSVQKVTFENLSDQAVELKVASALDADVKNEDANYDEHFWNVHEVTDDRLIAQTVPNDFGTPQFTSGMQVSYVTSLTHKAAEVTDTATVDRYFGTLEAGASVSFEKRVVVVTSRDYPTDDAIMTALQRLTDTVSAQSFDDLLAAHEAGWADRWQQSDIQIEGDTEAQQGMRFNLFELFSTYYGDDPRLNIGPKGFTGEKYGGATYWDTEAFAVPLYLALADKEVTHNLLEYRHNQLPGAYHNAQEQGLKGALYPMVTFNGIECHNEWEITFEEIHRNGTIAYAIYNYTRYTGDEEYVTHDGFDVLTGIARFWADRVHYSQRKGLYMIHGVTGPNEYENNVNNNWYTNMLAKWCLNYTNEIADKVSDEKLAELELTEEERNKWHEIADNMYLPEDKELGIFVQHDTFLDKDLTPVADIPADQLPLNQNWSWDKILRSPYIKQGDVMQGIWYFIDKFPEDVKKRNFEFYEPLTVHESSLSPSVHAIIAADLHKEDKAVEMYSRTARLDLDNYNNDTNDGLHITSMTGSWLAIVQGFAGMRVIDDELQFSPFVPKDWEGYNFRINFRDRLLEVTVNKEGSSIKLLKGDDLTIKLNGESLTLTTEK